MYYLYHIPGKKIGVTCNPLKRVTQTQGYKESEYEIILQSNDINYISEQERKLQKKFGYKEDVKPYNKLFNKMKLNITDQTPPCPIPKADIEKYLKKLKKTQNCTVQAVGNSCCNGWQKQNSNWCT